MADTTLKAEALRRVKPYEGSENYIFISYSHRDSARILPLLEKMTARGFRLWYDEGIDPGTEWPESIANHLAGSKVCLAFVSPTSVNSVNCRREINFALSRGKDFLSVLLEETQMTPGMEMQISSYQSLLSFKYPTWEEFEEKLMSLSILQSCKGAPQAAEVETSIERPVVAPQQMPGQPAYGQPIPEQMVYSQPVPGQPAYGQPVPGQTTYGQPAYGAAAATNPQAPAKKAKKLPLALIIAIPVIVIAAIVLIVFNPFKNRGNDPSPGSSTVADSTDKPNGNTDKNTVEIGGKKYKNGDALAFHDVEITEEQVKILSTFNKSVHLTCERCTFSHEAQVALSMMTQLQYLTLDECGDFLQLSFLNNLEALSELTMRSCLLDDSAFEGVRLSWTLTGIDLSDNRLARVPWTEALPNLQVLRLADNRITDISGLESCTALTVLDLSQNEVVSLEPLQNATALEELYLRDNPIKDLQPLEGCVFLKTLDLAYTPIVDSYMLSDIRHLEHVDLHMCDDLTDCDFLQYNTETLTFLDISGTNKSSTSPDFLYNCTKLVTLNINHCWFEDLSFAANMPDLEVLNAESNRFTDLSPLNNLTKLNVINLGNNRITSLEGLPAASQRQESNPQLILLLNENGIHDDPDNDQPLSLEALDPGYNYVILSVLGSTPDSTPLKKVHGGTLYTEMCMEMQPGDLLGFERVYALFSLKEFLYEWDGKLRGKLFTSTDEDHALDLLVLDLTERAKEYKTLLGTLVVDYVDDDLDWNWIEERRDAS